MKNLVAVFVAFCFVFTLVGIGLAADMKVEGKVVKMEGGFVTVKDAKGKDHKIHTNESTKMTGDIKVGSDVEAMIDDKHHAMSMMVKGDMGMKDDMKNK
jgi:hypothetical protein